MNIKRRAFLRACLGAGLAAGSGRVALAEDGRTATLTVKPGRRDHTIPADFMGLSYEASLISDSRFFSPDNHDFLGLIARLGGSGVLRIGGNSSEYTFWRADGDRTPIAKRHVLTPADIDRLAAFVKATGWKLIYGLNLGTGNPASAADEAAAVSAALGGSLLAFQIGNEPNLFGHNGLRPKLYSVGDYLGEWQVFADAVRTRVPNAPLAGPDTAGSGIWVMPMAQQDGSELVLLSQHYYPEGPGNSPKSTISRMLRSRGHLNVMLKTLQAASREAHLPYRMTEANSCYGGGRYGVSNTLAAALWGLDFQFQLAQHDAVGVNFHGGTGGAYSPIVRDADATYAARPLFYGMLMFAQGSRGRLAHTSLHGAGPRVTAYAIHDDARQWVTVINTDAARDVTLKVDSGGPYTQGTALRLTGPALDATTDITLGGATVGGDGAWSATETEPVTLQNGRFTLGVPAASAVTVALTT